MSEYPLNDNIEHLMSEMLDVKQPQSNGPDGFSPLTDDELEALLLAPERESAGER